MANSIVRTTQVGRTLEYVVAVVVMDSRVQKVALSTWRLLPRRADADTMMSAQGSIDYTCIQSVGLFF